MTPCSCREEVSSLRNQITAMRKEIKNIRKGLDSSVRAHWKHVRLLQRELDAWSNRKKEETEETTTNKTSQGLQRGTELSLETGRIQTVPIGFISSCFSRKNGTPRQPGLCMLSRATLQIQTSVFNNPDHALDGLQLYSHVWLIFLFHKNGHMSYKAKVKPPRLNGRKVGVYSTRSPHRPNAIGLSLAKLDSVSGDTLHLSGVDLITGTPVLDIKPYIPDYDSPSSGIHTDTRYSHTEETEDSEPEPEPEPEPEEPQRSESLSPSSELSPEPSRSDSSFDKTVLALREFLQQGALCAEGSTETQLTEREPEREWDSRLCFGADSYSNIAAWIRNPPVSELNVRFTSTAEREMREFQPPESTDPVKPRFRFLKGPEEFEAAVRGILSADPRSVYRRSRCRDRLFFFTLDTADITCWFGDGFVEVLQVRPVQTQQSPG
ncbi:tRNA (adenine(37)-N6)-methyltransferase [Hoplias malabaricus]|uniref:tRNA (adenine(37)-N6)-methyltransferase n=1 Tax=Hoplias malabaricus TaxID=27720 RepID=UPI0034634497